MGNEFHDVVLNCVPPGQMDTSKVQLYEWRTADNKVIASKYRKYKVDTNKGVLRIIGVKFTSSGRYFCSAVLPSEERITFTHNLIGM